jgi:glycosyltransferase involved in cell wall biosynthesis
MVSSSKYLVNLRLKTEMIQTGMRKALRFFKNHYPSLKPLVGWVPPRTRTWIKDGFMSVAFKFLHGSKPKREGVAISDRSSPQESAASLKKGVNLVGYPRSIIGEGEFIRQTANSLKQTNLDFGIVDDQMTVSLPVQVDDGLAPHFRSENPFKVNIFHLKPRQMESSIVMQGKSLVENRYNIGYWTWELAEFPTAWQAPLDFLDEVWCPSRFIQSAVSKRSSKPVLYQPISIELDTSVSFEREYFSLSPKAFIFLFVFDFKSHVSRKNPSACVEAFQRAFLGKGEAVNLVIKSMDGALFPKEFANLQEQAKKDPRILLIDEKFRPDEMIGLMQTADCFISLHRSEGIGLGLAQSMLLGKPVIATGYSGNTDFTLEDNSCLVKYDLVEVGKREYPFAKGQVWADPDVDHAAWYMRKLMDDESYRNSLAAKGQAFIRDQHNCRVTGERYLNRLRELGLA